MIEELQLDAAHQIFLDEEELTPIPEQTSVFVVPEAYHGKRLDQILALFLPEYSRSRLQQWNEQSRVYVNQKSLPSKQKLYGGEEIIVHFEPEPETQAFCPENITLECVYEDAHILVINKPAGLVTHPGNGNWTGTLLNGLLYYAPQLAQLPRAGIVHRLDKETSGLMVVAKTLEAQTDLVRQLQARSVSREYFAFVKGLIPSTGTIAEPIGRHPTQRIKMAVVASGKPAVTHYQCIKHFEQQRVSWVRCRLETGRTHQIRVHLTHLGFPLIGDSVYTGRTTIKTALSFARQALHATRLALIHPIDKKEYAWECPLPEDMQHLLAQLQMQEAEMEKQSGEKNVS